MESIARIALANSATAIRTASPGADLGLTIGQVVRAQVTRVEGNTVQLRWGDQAVSVATRIPLSVGQQVSLLVEEGRGGKTLLRMVDDSFGQSRPTRSIGSGNGRGTGPSAPTRGRPGPAAGVTGWADRPDVVANEDASFWGSDGDPNAPAGSGGRPFGTTSRPRPAEASATAAWMRANGPFRSGNGGAGPAGQLLQARAAVREGGPFTPDLFEAPDGAAPRLAGSTRTAGGGPAAHGLMARGGTVPSGVVARAALPTYSKLAQSISGPAAFGQLMATLGHDVGQTLARAPLAPAELGRLLIDMGVHPDEANAVLVGEMLAQGIAVSEGSIRRLRRDLGAAGGSLRDAAPTVALSRLGLPITPLTLAIARQLKAGQLDPKAAWGELLVGLQRMARGTEAHGQAGVLASELLTDWRMPLEKGADGIAQWLRATVDQVATPLEAKLARSLLAPVPADGSAATPGQDVRARLDLLAQALPHSARTDRGALAEALQRTQATMQAEQILNGATSERTEQRYFAVTLPVVTEQQPSTLELRVRERDAQPHARGDVTQPDVVQMKISLPALGDLGINLMVGQHSISCHFAAGSAFAEALLNASSGELAGRLKRLGFAHAAIDAAHEPVETTAPLLTAAPRVSRVDVQA